MSARYWIQHSFGYLPDGSRVMLALVSADYPSRRQFPVVLQCREDGLYRLWRDGSSRLLAPGYVWPQEIRKPPYEAETSLGQHVPKAWGIHRLSDCVIQQIPARILKARTDNLARLLIAWFFNQETVVSTLSARMDRLLRPLTVLPPAPLWRPVAITLVPNTDVVVRAINTGALLQRLKLGLERIYVSEMACIRAPRIEATLQALAHRFPSRLVLVKAESLGLLTQIMKVKRVRASEYQFVGYQLKNRYKEDFDYDKFDNPSSLAGMLRLRVGDIPRGLQMLWMHELAVDFEQWAALDIDGMLNVEKLANDRRALQDKQAVDFVMLTLNANKEPPNG